MYILYIYIHVCIYIFYLEEDLYGEDAGEAVVELAQEMVPLAVYVHRVLDVIFKE